MLNKGCISLLLLAALCAQCVWTHDKMRSQQRPRPPTRQLQTPFAGTKHSKRVYANEKSNSRALVALANADDNDDDDDASIDAAVAKARLKLKQLLMSASDKSTPTIGSNHLARRPAIVAPQLPPPSQEHQSERVSVSNERGDDLATTDEDDTDSGSVEREEDYDDGQVNYPDQDENENENENENEGEQEEINSQIEDERYDPYNNFYDRDESDGTYVYGYALPNGVTRYERSYHSDRNNGQLVVEGFHTEPRYLSQGLVYELRCYRSNASGYHPLRVQYLAKPPRVVRDEAPNVNCFDN